MVPLKFPDVALTDSKISVAVMPFDNNTGDPALNWSSQGIADMFVTNLSRSGYIRLISLDRIRRVLSNMGEENIKEVDQDFSKEFTRRVDAQFIIAGSIFKSDSKFRMIVQMYDMRSDGQMKAEQVDGRDQEEMLKMVDRLSDRIKVALEIEAAGTPAMAEEIARVKTNSLEAYNYYTRGQEYQDNLDYENAILNLREATQIDTSFAYAYDALATVYNALGEMPLARQAIDRALAFSTNFTDEERLKFLYNQARLTYDYDAVEAYLRKLAVLEPDNPEWHFRLGWQYSTHKRSYDQGILEYKKAIAIDPDSQPRFYYSLGYAYLEYGLPEEALATFKKYVSLLPNKATSHVELGKAYVLTGNYELAKSALNRALELEPDFASTYSILGMYYAAKGKSREALEYFRQHQMRTFGTKQEELGYYFLAKFYFDNSNWEQALAKIEKAVDRNPDRLTTMWLSGLVRLQMGNADSARTMCNKMENILTAKGSKHEMEFVYHLKGKISQAAGEFEAAIEHYQQAIRLGYPDQAYFRTDLANAYFATGDLDRAIQAYKSVFEINPNDVYGYYGLGQVYEKKSNTSEAIQAYKRCLEIWNDADLDMPLLHKVKNKLAKLTKGE
jgi:tetratricopeptide (TPR) repeat protein